MRTGLLASLAVVLLLIPSGCQLTAIQGPGSRSLTTSRQFSQQGVAAIERGQWERAEQLLSLAVQTCPANADARRSYADTLWHRGARKEAIAELVEALRRDPENASLHVRMAELRLELGEVPAAAENAERAVNLDPKLAAAWAVRARVMRAKNDRQEALANFHRALSYDPSDRAATFEVADLYREMGQPQRSLATLQALTDNCSPGEEPQRALYLQGLAYLALQRYDDAVTSLTAASSRDRATPEILCSLAEAQLAAGSPSNAVAAARQALALDPKHRPSRQILDRVELARHDEERAGE